MNPMRLIKWSIPLFLVLSLFGCGPSKPKIGGKPPTKFYYTCVSLSPGATELAVSYLQLQLLGRTASCDFPPGAVEGKPIIMKGVKPDYEAIAALRPRPDVVLYDPAIIPKADIDKFKSLNIDTLAIGGSTIDEYVTSLYDAAGFTGSETSVAPYIDHIRDAEVAAKTSADKPLKLAIIMPGDGTEHMIAGTEGFLGDVVRHLGAIPVGPKSKQFEKLNIESIIADDPDVIVIPGAGDKIVADPRFKMVHALQLKNVYGLDPDILLREGARVNSLLTNMHKIIIQSRK